MKPEDALFCYKTIAVIYGYLNAYEDVDMPGQLADVLKILEKELVKPEQDPKPKLVKLEPVVRDEPKENDIEVANRPECLACQYRKQKSFVFCDYAGMTGKLRAIPVRECEHYKDKRRHIYNHVCASCGREFRDHAARTKLCPACKGNQE